MAARISHPYATLLSGDLLHRSLPTLLGLPKIRIERGRPIELGQHIHMHVRPRWLGDVNFMTAVGETRVLPEDLDTTWEKLRKALLTVDERK